MSKVNKIVIVGGVAGGASCAARLRRMDEHAEIILIERGPHVSFANCGLPYYIGDVIQDESSLLVSTADTFRKKFAIDVRAESTVTAINRIDRCVNIQNKDGSTYTEPYDALVLSPGAKPLRPPLPGIDLDGIFGVRTIPDSQKIKQWITKRTVQTAVVIGAGFIGLEMAENLHHRGIDVQIIERADQVMPPLDAEMASRVQNYIEKKQVAVHLNNSVTHFEKHEESIHVHTSNGTTLQTDLVILAIGVSPESTLAKESGLRIGERGHILVDEHMRTEDPYVYAIGDAVEVKNFVTDLQSSVPLAGPANRQGRMVADIIAGQKRSFRGVQGTAVCGAFGLTIAATGINERTLRSANMCDYDAIYLHPGDHVGYYPGAKPIHIKVLACKKDGRILGAQAIGEAGVERRIDVIAMAIQMGGTVYDLEDAELCYAPQYGAAKDPVNMAGMIGANCQRGDCTIAPWSDIHAADVFLLDVRNPEECEAAPLPNAHIIPLDALRARLDEIPRNTRILVSCGVGQRAWNAVRILSQNGYNAELLSGGAQTYYSLPEA